MSKSKPATFLEDSPEHRSFYDFYKPHDAVDLVCDDPSLTRQEMAEDCDINVIMKRYEVTGQLPPGVDLVKPEFMDVTDAPDLMTALRLMEEARASFMRLPATVRREFDNDPVEFVAFAQDPANLDQMRTWGLAPPAPAERPPVADRPLTELTGSEFVELTRAPPKAPTQ